MKNSINFRHFYNQSISSDSGGLESPSYGSKSKVRIYIFSFVQANMKRVTDNAYKNYIRSRPNASAESVKRIKAMKDISIGYHPVFGRLIKLHVSSNKFHILRTQTEGSCKALPNRV